MDDAIRQKIRALLDQHRIMALATLRPDGWPQATTVGYASDGLTLYFLCGLDSQKAANLARDDRVSLTIDHNTPNVMEITGLSMAAHARRIADRTEAEQALALLMHKYPEPQEPLPFPMPAPEEVAIFRVTPVVISVLDYTKGLRTPIWSRARSGSLRGVKKAAKEKRDYRLFVGAIEKRVVSPLLF